MAGGQDSPLGSRVRDHLRPPLSSVLLEMSHHIAKAAPLEIDDLSGHINRKGRRLGTPTPHHAPLYAMLKPRRGGLPPLT